MNRLSKEDQLTLMKNRKIQILEHIHTLTLQLYKIEEAEILEEAKNQSFETDLLQRMIECQEQDKNDMLHILT